MSTAIEAFKPIFFMNTEDVTDEERSLAKNAIEEVLGIGGARGKVYIEDLGVWRLRDYKDVDGNLTPHRSVDWYTSHYYNPTRRQIDTASTMWDLVFSDPWMDSHPHYDVILTAQDLYTEKTALTEETKFVVGNAYPGRGTIVSVIRFRDMKRIPERKMRDETKKQEVYHEIGHIFYLPDRNRRKALAESLGYHCTNICAMRQGMIVPEHWVNFALEREKTRSIYCNMCTKELRNYFGKK